MMATRYLVNGGVAFPFWDSPIGWAATSGGAGGASPPTANDDVIIDHNSFPTPGVTFGMNNALTDGAACKSLTFVGVTNNPTFNFSGFESSLVIFGDLTLESGLTFTRDIGTIGDQGFHLQGTGAISLSFGGLTTLEYLYLEGAGTVTLQDTMTITQAFFHTNGTFNANNKDMTINNYSGLSDGGDCALIMGTGAWTIGAFLRLVASTHAFTVDGATTDLDLTDNTQLNTNLTMSLHDVTVTGTVAIENGVGGVTPAQGNISMNSLTLAPDCSFTMSGTITAQTLIALGTSGHLVSIGSFYGGGILNSDNPTIQFVAVSDNTAGGNIPFNDTVGGVDNGNNFNWVFPVSASFASPTGGVAPYTFAFIDLSTGTITDWLWDFGDGNFSDEQNPTHIYASAGIYEVSLTVSNIFVSDSFTGDSFEVTDSGELPDYTTSLISAVGRSQQIAPTTRFIFGGQNDNGDLALFKKSTTYAFEIWRSAVYQIGEMFDILRIEFPVYPVLAANMTIVVRVYFDDGSSFSTANTINATTYPNSQDLIVLTSKNFGNKVRGNSNFFIEIQFQGSALVTVGLPINIEFETYNI